MTTGSSPAAGSKDERAKVLEEAIKDKKGFEKLGQVIGEEIRARLEDNRRHYKPGIWKR